MAMAFAPPAASHLQPSSSFSICSTPSSSFSSSSSSSSSSTSRSHSLFLKEPLVWLKGQNPTCRRVFLVKCSTAETLEGCPSLTAPPQTRRRIVGKGTKLIGCGSAAPKLVLSNDYLSKIVDTNDEWITVRTGIRNRRVLSGKD